METTSWRISIVSPGSAITRLMKSSFSGCASPIPSPSQCRTLLMPLRSGSSAAFGFSNTITSPRAMSPPSNMNLLTNTRSPTSSVGTIDSDGM